MAFNEDDWGNSSLLFVCVCLILGWVRHVLRAVAEFKSTPAQSSNFLPVSVGITSANTPLTKAGHMTDPRLRVGGC